MNARTALAALALTAGLAAPAAAGTHQVYGIPMYTAETELDVLGVTNLSHREFPAFGNFVWQENEGRSTFSSAFGMVYRTHRHILARRDRTPQTFGGWLSDSTPLADAPFPGRLKAMIAEDVKRRPVFTSQASSPSDAREFLLARLDGHDRRELSFAISSQDKFRVRPIFVYLATKPKKDGKYWTCKFYDPNVAPGSEGAAANAKRTFALRLPVEGGSPEVSTSWLEDANDDHGAYGDPSQGQWSPIGWDQLHTADSNEATGWSDVMTGIETYANDEPSFLESVSRAVNPLDPDFHLSRATRATDDTTDYDQWELRAVELKDKGVKHKTSDWRSEVRGTNGPID